MRSISLLLLIVVALAGVGCGKSDENEYVKRINAVDAKLSATVAGVSTGADDRESAADGFERAARRIDAIADDYRAIDPPENAARAHARTIAGTTGLAALFRDFSRQTRAANTEQEVVALRKRAATIADTEPFEQFALAREELAKAGYKIETPANGR